jgi:hypothetical protein
MLKVVIALLVIAFLVWAIFLRHHPGTRDTHSYNKHSNQWSQKDQPSNNNE